ncbi:MAG TPA: BON domain-containing protein [Roseiarcus sp.]|nr:BON domain-containing protein [Roseiarcus sp.]
MHEIQQRVLNELHFDLALPRDRLRVRFMNSYVILSGEVDWPYQKSCAEADALRVPGVSVVINDIAIRRNAVPSHASLQRATASSQIAAA